MAAPTRHSFLHLLLFIPPTSSLSLPPLPTSVSLPTSVQSFAAAVLIATGAPADLADPVPSAAEIIESSASEAPAETRAELRDSINAQRDSQKAQRDAQKNLRAEFLDSVVDPDDQTEVLVFKESSSLKDSAAGYSAKKQASAKTQRAGAIAFTKRRFNEVEIAGAGLLAGGAVEIVRTIVTHPFDTVRVRLQAKKVEKQDWFKPAVRPPPPPPPPPPSPPPTWPTAIGFVESGATIAPPSPSSALVPTSAAASATGALVPKKAPWEILGPNPWDGLSLAVLLSAVGQGAVFWAVKDVVRREILAWAGVTSGKGTLLLKYFSESLATAQLPAVAESLGLDWRAIATIAAVTLGQACYWIARAPTEVAKTAAQAQVGGDQDEGGQASSSGVSHEYDSNPIAAVFGAYPVLALTDLGVIPVRVSAFLLLRNIPPLTDALTQVLGNAGPTGFASDLVLYIIASIIANGICTPLEVVRTRLLLQRSGRSITQYENIYDALVTIGAEEGVAGLWAGLRFRLLWNGLLSGTILFVQRFYYADAQKFFLELVDAIASGSPIR